ncbi:MAG: glycosyltransferase [Dysgonamonadaceae bacterium]|jgi:glycosyltransferase involved in cell wall biosynthesis|nr:glycosyltransferase [Dysgonamonadaceae bacterium]
MESINIKKINKTRILDDVSLVIAVYNKPIYLEKVFDSLEKQSRFPANVILADDGSSDAALDALIEQYKKRLPVPLIRVWHEDKGWRKPLCVNKAVHHANDYIIFIDEDVIMHPRFIENHWRYKKPDTAMYGTTAILTPEMTEKLLNIKPFEDALIDKKFKKRNTWYLPFPVSKNTNKFAGRNFSMYKKDFIAVNGYDNDLIGEVGWEDTDLSYRLKNNGVNIRRIFGRCLGKHLYHKLHPYFYTQKIEQERDRLIKKRIETGFTRVENGYHEALSND